jgi:hypothetical protein
MPHESSIEKKRVLYECIFAKLDAPQVYTLKKKLKNVVFIFQVYFSIVNASCLTTPLMIKIVKYV